MRISHENFLFALDFNYDKDKKGRRRTNCAIYRLKDAADRQGELISSGRAVPRGSDVFVKCEGRKTALTKALQRKPDFFNRTVRTAIWESYWERNKI